MSHRHLVIWGSCTLLLVLVLYLPALNMFMFGDGYELIDYCSSGWRNPLIFFDIVNNFFRPLVNFIYVLHYTLFGEQFRWYVLSSLTVHLVNIALLYLLVWRVSRNVATAAVTTLLFGTSPKYSDLTLGLGFTWAPDATLLTCFLGTLLCLFERHHMSRPINSILITCCLAGAIGSKESWIILPLLVGCFLLLLMRYSLKNALFTTLPFLVAAGVYGIILFVIPYFAKTSSALNYLGNTPSNNINLAPMIIKFCYLIYDYIGLGEFFSGAMWQILLLLICLGGLLWGIIRLNNRLALWGLTWMVLTLLPSLPIYYAPTRYNYHPLLGFWVMVVALGAQLLRRLIEISGLRPRLIWLAAGVGIGWMVSYHAIMLQWEIVDYRRLGDAYQTVITMYKQIQPHVPTDRPLVFINEGARRPIQELVESLRGYIKLIFARDTGVWQLINFAPLVNFIGDPFTLWLVPVADAQRANVLAQPLTVVVFTDQGFLLANDSAEQIRQYYRAHARLPDNMNVYQFRQP